jgi:AcrR family transcriptional regulator
MAKKAPRRTAERIQAAALDLFNRLGEPNVSTGMVAADLGISPGNLHYHFPTKETLVTSLFDAHRASLQQLLGAAGDVGDVEDAWFFMHSLFERLWTSRFLYRDLADLLGRSRHLESGMQMLAREQQAAFESLIAGLVAGGALQIDPREVPLLAQGMTLTALCWLSFAFVRDPRHALETDHAADTLLGGARLAMQQLAPYLQAGSREHWVSLIAPYAQGQGSRATDASIAGVRA